MDALGMTKENKLALVVGFGLVLLVGILISDHFSTARQQTAAELVQISDPLVLRDRQNDPQLLDFQPPPPPVQQMPQSPLTQQHAADPNHVIQDPSQHPYNATVYVDPRNVGQPVSSGFMASREQQVIRLPDLQRNEIQYVDIGVDENGNRVLRPVEAPQSPAVTMTGQQQTRPAVAQPKLAPGEQLHTIAAGESLSSICAKHYGNRSLVKALARHNGLENPDVVKAGTSLRIPPVAVLTGTASNAKPAESISANAGGVTRAAGNAPAKPASNATYTVQPGDTLSSIAAKLMGSAGKWEELYEHNASVIDDPEHVIVGTVIRIPR